MMRAHHHPRRHAGFTLIEIMIALTIGVFLLFGLLTIVMDTRRVFGSQQAMSQLQDNERLAMMMISDVIQQAGYYPYSATATAGTTFLVTAPFATAGQSIFGTHAVAAPGDTITVAYVSAPGDGMITCTGGSNPAVSGANMVYTATFSISGGALACVLKTVNQTTGATTTAAIQPLVTGITNLQILYGVKTDFTFNNGAPDSYLTATQMNATNWLNVYTVVISLTFTNPLAGQAGQAATINFQRTVAVMRETGVYD
jgi:type IV pilus assembly protein PilW